jgi:hypothetical protein
VVVKRGVVVEEFKNLTPDSFPRGKGNQIKEKPCARGKGDRIRKGDGGRRARRPAPLREEDSEGHC